MVFNKFFLLLLLVFFKISASLAQIVHLKTEDKQPLPSVKIINDSNKQLGVFYSEYINIAELNTLSQSIFITSSDYESLKIRRDGSTDTIDAILIPKAYLINTVVVSSSKNKQKFQDIPNSVVKIDPYLIENRNNTELTEVINQIPSVNIIDNQASIRGGSGWSYGSGSRVMVTVDGLPAISGDANQIQWQFLDLQNIENIEVLKGSSSVLYGSSALNGSINITTKSASDSLTGQVNSYFGVYSKPAKDSLHWTSKSLLKYGVNSFVSFKKNKTDYVFTTVNVIDNGYRMAEESNRTRLGVKIKHSYSENLELGVNIAGMYNQGSTFLLWESGGYGYTALDSSFNVNKTKRFALDPYFKFKGKKVVHQILGRFFLLDNNIYQQDTLSNQSNASQFSYLEYRGYTNHFLNSIQLTYGFVANTSKTNSPLFQGVQKASNLASYLQLEKRVKKWFFSTGVRYEHFYLNDRNEGRPVVKAGLTFTPKKFSILRASYGEGYRFPSIAESFIQTSVGPVTIYANPNLKPETAWNGEIGIKQGFKAKGLNGYVDAALFYNEINNMMEFTFAQWSQDNSLNNLLGLGFKSVNTGTAIIKGIDLNILGSFTFGKQNKHKVTILTGYTYNDATSKFPNQVITRDSQERPLTYTNTSQDTVGNYLKYRSLHSFKGDLQWERGTLGAGISCRYNSFIRNIDKAFVTFPIDLFVPGVERLRSRKGNLIFDLRLSKTWGHGYKSSIIVNNLLNNIVMERPADLQAPRYFMVQVVKNF